MANLGDPLLEALMQDRQARLAEAATLRLALSLARRGQPPVERGAVVRAWLGRALARAGAWALRHGNAWAREARRPA